MLVWMGLTAAGTSIAADVNGPSPMRQAQQQPPVAPPPQPPAANSPANPPANPPASPPASPPANTPALPPKRPAAVILDNKEVSGVLGSEVRSAANENMGRVVDVIADRSGRVRAAIIDFGGFLGVGSRKIAVDWNALHFSQGPDRNRVTLELTRDQVKAAPEYQEGKPIVMLGAVAVSDDEKSAAKPEQ